MPADINRIAYSLFISKSPSLTGRAEKSAGYTGRTRSLDFLWQGFFRGTRILRVYHGRDARATLK
jgi:hypothetical protein